MKDNDYTKHSPLKYGEIRLLKLHPGSGTADLESNLVRPSISTNLRSDSVDSEKNFRAPPCSSPEPYEALSYTWGSENNDLFIKILAESEAYCIPIRPN